jgi:hypothetical protein
MVMYSELDTSATAMSASFWRAWSAALRAALSPAKPPPMTRKFCMTLAP